MAPSLFHLGVYFLNSKKSKLSVSNVIHILNLEVDRLLPDREVYPSTVDNRVINKPLVIWIFEVLVIICLLPE